MIDQAQGNLFISENQAWHECSQFLSGYTFVYKAQIMVITVLVLFVVFMLYKLYYQKFNKVNQKVDKLWHEFQKWELKTKNKQRKGAGRRTKIPKG